MNYGFVRVAASVPEMRVADCGYNASKIIEATRYADKFGGQFIVFPELSVTGYSCGDLFMQKALLAGAEKQLAGIMEKTKDIEIVILIGMPVNCDNQLFNCGIIIHKGKLLGVVPKTYIPGYNEFYEERWFASGNNTHSDNISICGHKIPFGTDLLFDADNYPGLCFGLEVCEDLWVPIPPSSYQAIGGAVMLFNLSASNEIIGKHEYRRNLVRQQSAKCTAAYVYSSSGVHESTTDVVYGGHALISEYGTILAESERFADRSQIIFSDVDIEKLLSDRCRNTSFMEAGVVKKFRKIEFSLGNKEFGFDGRETILNESCGTSAAGTREGSGADTRASYAANTHAHSVTGFQGGKIQRFVQPYPFVPADTASRDERCREIFAIQTAGLAKRFRHTGLRHAVIGISGGLDSTLALMVTARTFDKLGLPRGNILAITMPGFGTTNDTLENAKQLIRSMKASIKEIDIKASCFQHFSDIGHDSAICDVTYENVQARERTQILMDIANKVGALVIGTGDLSELALGWCTYNGDHMSMYGVNCSVPKTLVRFLVGWTAENVADDMTKQILYRILETPISPELLPPDSTGKINQKTEDIIGPYELHDFFLYHMIRYGASPAKILFLAKEAFKDKYEDETIKKWLRIFYKRFFSQQFKRSCLPDGPKVGTVSLSPRGDWRMPSDAEASLWLEELEN